MTQETTHDPSPLIRLSAIALGAALLAGCAGTSPGNAKKHHISGEPYYYGVNQDGAIVPRNQVSNGRVVPHKGEVIAIVVENVFLRYLQETIGSPHVLVYAVIHDDVSEDPDTAITRVVYEGKDQTNGVSLPVADRTIYGPIPFKGHAIRIQLYVVELDRDQRETASRLISAAGAVASGAQPEAAPAINVVVQVAQFLNELNEDDWELKTDFTLYPATGPQAADGRARRASVMPLVAPGSLLIVKREVEARVPGDICSAPARLLVNYGREKLYWSYAGAGADAEADVVVTLTPKIEAGHLFGVVEAPDQAIVRETCGPNQGFDRIIDKNDHIEIRDQTYAVLSVVTGLSERQTEEALRAAAKRDAEHVGKLLIRGPTDLLGPSLRENIDAVAAALKVSLQQAAHAAEASRRVAQDPDFRKSTAYPAFWAARIEAAPLADGDELAKANAAANNAAVLEVLKDLVIGLPRLDPADAAMMKRVASLGKADFEADGARAGQFQLTAEGTQKLARSTGDDSGTTPS